MKVQILALSIIAGGAIAWTQPGIAQPAPASPAPAERAQAKQADTKQRLDSEDEDFLERAAESGHTEIAGSKLAQQKARSADVKAFAEQMIADHTKVAQELAALAKSKGYTPPTEPSLIDKAKLKTLEMRDEGFDKAYADEIGVQAHQDAVDLFKQAAEQAKDADVKAFAVKTLPALEQHLTMAKALQQKVGK